MIASSECADICCKFLPLHLRSYIQRRSAVGPLIRPGPLYLRMQAGSAPAEEATCAMRRVPVAPPFRSVFSVELTVRVKPCCRGVRNE